MLSKDHEGGNGNGEERSASTKDDGLLTPIELPVLIGAHCFPKSQQTKHIRAPIHLVCLALKELAGMEAYKIQQALEGLVLFWTGVANKTKKLEDYCNYFGE